MGGLQRIGMPEGPQNGLAGLGWLGWLGYRRVPISVAEASVPFGRGPPAVGPGTAANESRR